jgi:hypothetical protein
MEFIKRKVERTKEFTELLAKRGLDLMILVKLTMVVRWILSLPLASLPTPRYLYP